MRKLALTILASLYAGIIFASYIPARSVDAGHHKVHNYVFFNMERERIAEPSFLNTNRFEGAQLKYTWKELEPEPGVYDFSAIKTDLDYLNAHGKRLFLQIQDVTFNPIRNCVPAYLTKDPAFSGGVALQFTDQHGKIVDGWVARRWDPAVAERFHRLLTALGREFDGKVEGVTLPETAVDVLKNGNEAPPGFGFETYRNAVIANMVAIKQAFPHSRCIQYANFMPGEGLPDDDRDYLRSIYRQAEKLQVCIGGPDLLPYKKSQQTYNLMHEYAKGVTTAIAVQDGNYEYINPQTKKRITIAELADFAEKYLNVDFLFWCTQEPYFSSDVVRFMQTGKP